MTDRYFHKMRLAIRNNVRDASPIEAAPTVSPAPPDTLRAERVADHLGAIRTDQWMTKEAARFLAEDTILFADPRARDPRFVGRFAAKMFSQNYEDAIIADIFSRIGEDRRTFLEIGSGDGRENATRFLSMLGWSGVWLEGDPENVRIARDGMRAAIAEGRLTIAHSMVRAEAINDVIAEAGVVGDVDLISIDIDQNTSHVWRALATTARVVCIEYNAALPPTTPYEVPYAADGTWDFTNHYGASLKTLEIIGRKKGMSLVGCDLHGVNAFFVRDDLLGDRFQAPYTAEHHFQPARFSLAGGRGHQRPSWTNASPEPPIPGDARVTRLRIDGIPAQPFYVHGPRDRYVSECLIATGRMENVETDLFLQLVRLAGGFLDIGANIGYYTVLASLVSPLHSQIVAVEPDPSNMALLRANTRVDSRSHRVVPIAAAVDERHGTTELHLSDENFGDHRIEAVTTEQRRKITVETETLAALLQRFPAANLIKIDTQGAEARILCPAIDALRAARDQLILIFEFWPMVLRDDDAKQIVELLGALELSLYDLDEDRQRITQTTPEELLAYHAACKAGRQPREFTNVVATCRPDAIAVLEAAAKG